MLMKKLLFLLMIVFSAAAFEGCQPEQKSEADKDAKAKRAHKGENAQEVQD